MTADPTSSTAVVTMDQRKSRDGGDLVERALARLNEQLADMIIRPFERTAGDEMQAVMRPGAWIVDFVLHGARAQDWWIGIGLGAVDEPLGESARDSRGEAFYRARAAVDEAKGKPWGFALIGPPGTDRVQRSLLPLAYIVRRRTDRQHAAAELLRRHGSATAVAQELGLSKSTISESLRGAGAVEDIAGRDLAAQLLAEVGDR